MGLVPGEVETLYAMPTRGLGSNLAMRRWLTRPIGTLAPPGAVSPVKLTAGKNDTPPVPIDSGVAGVAGGPTDVCALRRCCVASPRNSAPAPVSLKNMAIVACPSRTGF